MFNMVKHVKPQAPSSDGESPRKTGAMASHGSMPAMQGAGCHEHVTNGGPSDDILTRFPTPWKIPCLEKIAWFSHGLPWFPRIFLAKFSRVSTPSDPTSVRRTKVQPDHGYLHFNTIHSTDGTCTWLDIRLSTVKLHVGAITSGCSFWLSHNPILVRNHVCVPARKHFAVQLC